MPPLPPSRPIMRVRPSPRALAAPKHPSKCSQQTRILRFYTPCMVEGDASGQGRSVEVVRGYTSEGAQCDAAPLCNTQCAGVPMYEAWRATCDVR